MSCAKCNVPFAEEKEAATCSECNLSFHAACCKLRTAQKLQRMKANYPDTWRCDACASEEQVVSLLQKLQAEVTATRKENSTNFLQLKNSMTAVEESVKELKERLTTVENENAELKKEITALKENSVAQAKSINNLQFDMNDMQQYSRRCNIEIRGVPATANENVYAIMEAVAAAIGVPYSRDSISIAHRVRGRQLPIIAQFISRSTKEAWLSAARGKRLNSTDLKATLTPSPIYINEHLTFYNKNVLLRGKQLVKTDRLAYAWSKRGAIFVRRTENEPAVRVWCELDVEKAALPRPKTKKQRAEMHPYSDEEDDEDKRDEARVQPPPPPAAARGTAAAASSAQGSSK